MVGSFGNKICSFSNLATTPTLFHSHRPMRFIVALVLSSMWFDVFLDPMNDETSRERYIEQVNAIRILDVL